MDDKKSLYKLNTVFNVILNPNMYKWLLFVNIFFVAWAIFVRYKFNENISVIVSCVLGVNIIMVFDLMYHSPKSILIDGDSIKFDEYARIKKAFYTKHGFRWRRVSYTVYDVRDVELYQNGFEKLFDVGRIYFKGRAEVTAKRDLDQIIAKHEFTFYGVKNFSLVKREFMNK